MPLLSVQLLWVVVVASRAAGIYSFLSLSHVSFHHSSRHCHHQHHQQQLLLQTHATSCLVPYQTTEMFRTCCRPNDINRTKRERTLHFTHQYRIQSSTSSSNESIGSIPRIDQILSQLTSLFPMFVLGSAIVGSFAPQTLNWVNSGNWMSGMLAGVMLGTGMTLERSDFTNILASRTQRRSIPVGVLCQFILMPLSALLIGRTMLLPFPDTGGKHFFLGLVLVGCSPGGTASNLVTLIAGADVALSVLLTTCSTVLASAVTPLLTKLIVGSAVPVSGLALCIACAKVVLAPVALGVMLNEYMPSLCKWVSRWTPFASVLLVALICGGVVASTCTTVGSFPARLLLSVITTHSLGFAAGYIVPKYMLGFSEQTARTISIETGMQNSALAVVLAKSIGADPLSFLPGALSATVHSCLGSGLAAFWRVIDSRKIR